MCCDSVARCWRVRGALRGACLLRNHLGGSALRRRRHHARHALHLDELVEGGGDLILRDLLPRHLAVRVQLLAGWADDHDAPEREALAHQVALDVALGLEPLAERLEVAPRAQRVGEEAAELEVDLAVAQLLVEGARLVDVDWAAREVAARELGRTKILLLLGKRLLRLRLLQDGDRRDGRVRSARSAKVVRLLPA